LLVGYRLNFSLTKQPVATLLIVTNNSLMVSITTTGFSKVCKISAVNCNWSLLD